MACTSTVQSNSMLLTAFVHRVYSEDANAASKGESRSARLLSRYERLGRLLDCRLVSYILYPTCTTRTLYDCYECPRAPVHCVNMFMLVQAVPVGWRPRRTGARVGGAREYGAAGRRSGERHRRAGGAACEHSGVQLVRARLSGQRERCVRARGRVQPAPPAARRRLRVHLLGRLAHCSCVRRGLRASACADAAKRHTRRRAQPAASSPRHYWPYALRVARQFYVYSNPVAFYLNLLGSVVFPTR